MHEAYPEIIQVIDDFISQNGAESRKRRRDDTQFASNGVSVPQIRRAVLQKVPKLKNISESTIRRTLLPPHQGRAASNRYKSLVNAKVPPKRNDHSATDSALSHYCRSQVKQVLDLAFMHEKEVVVASCDNKV